MITLPPGFIGPQEVFESSTETTPDCDTTTPMVYFEKAYEQARENGILPGYALVAGNKDGEH